MTAPGSPSGRVLDPQERVAEILFGLIMALSFTGAIQVSVAGRDEVQPVVIAAIGCNVAWGIIDAVMYLLQQLVDRGRARLVALRFCAAADDATRRAILAEAAPLPVVEVLRSEDLAKLRDLAAARAPTARVRIQLADLRGACGVFLLVVVATFPVVLPYLLVDDLQLAKRTSNGVSIALLFTAGYALGRYSGGRPLRLGFAMVGLGIALVGVTIALGG